MSERIGVIAILITDRNAVPQVNTLLTEYGNLIVGRLGIPYREKGVSVISITVDGSTDEIGALTGKLGMIKGVKNKSLLLTQ